MADLELGRQRLVSQRICGGSSSTPLETVESMGAFQAQDYLSGLWAVGLRTKDSTLSSIEKALSDKTIVRSPPASKHDPHSACGELSLDARADGQEDATGRPKHRPFQRGRS